jgi:FG-GAP repeat protein
LPLRSCPSRLRIVLLVAVALFAVPRVGAASSLTSRILFDPEGEHTGDEFGASIAWVGDVNGDGYDDVLVGAFRYAEIQSVGQAYLYFGGPASDSVADLVITGFAEPPGRHVVLLPGHPHRRLRRVDPRTGLRRAPESQPLSLSLVGRASTRARSRHVHNPFP